VAGSREHDTGSSVFIKGGEFIDKLSVVFASQERLCSIDLVIMVTSEQLGFFKN
jgi:hypothetical protein